MFLPKTSKCCFTRLSDTLYLGAFLIIGTLHFVKWILLGPIQVVLIFHHFLIVSLVKFTHSSLQYMKRYVLRQLKRIGCDPCRFPQNVLLLMERLCEGSVTNRDTCSRKSLRWKDLSFPGSFCNQGGVHFVKSRSKIFLVPGHWADKQI